MLLLVPALVVPNLGARAAQPTISVPDRAIVGSTVTISGNDFVPSSSVRLTVGPQSLDAPVAPDGHFQVQVRLGSTIEVGRQRVRAFDLRDGRRGRQLAFATLVVEPPPPTSILSQATPAASSVPTATLLLTTPTPRVLSTATPAPTPLPTTAPAPATTAPQPVAPPPTQAPTAPPATASGKGAGRVFVIAPNGSDSGAGTVASPWQTYGHASQFLKPGDTLYARGGRYYGQGGYAWNAAASGTASAPIWFAAYPGEVPVFDGGNAQEQFLIFYDQTHNVIVDGLRVENYHPVQNGILLLINGAHDIVIQNMVMAGNHGTSATPIEHLIYPGASPYNITIRNNVLDAAGLSGGAIHMYHDPGPRNVLIEGNVIRNGFWGVIVASTANGVTIRGNTFSGNRRANIEVWDSAVNVTVIGNSPNDTVLH